MKGCGFQNMKTCDLFCASEETISDTNRNQFFFVKTKIVTKHI